MASEGTECCTCDEMGERPSSQNAERLTISRSAMGFRPEKGARERKKGSVVVEIRSEEWIKKTDRMQSGWVRSSPSPPVVYSESVADEAASFTEAAPSCRSRCRAGY